MSRAGGKLEESRSISTLNQLAEVPINSAVRLIFASLVTAIFAVAAGTLISQAWLFAIVAILGSLTVLYFTYHLPAQTTAAETSHFAGQHGAI